VGPWARRLRARYHAACIAEAVADEQRFAAQSATRTTGQA
jgi:hypothetical protein